MQFSKFLVAAFASLTAAQNMSLCDKYTTALLMTNNATNQLTVLTLVVNTALIGNYTPTLNKGVTVNGILNKGMYNNVSVNLLPYFDGSLLSSNRAGKPTAVNFLDDGGAAPLMKNMASAGNTTSNQYMLVTHLYSFFGALLGCSTLGQMGFPAYGGNTNMAQVHQYMDLNPTQLGYFIQEVGLSALSFGVTMDDATAVGKALNQHFGYRCGPVESIIPQSTAQNQSICSDSTCPVAANSSCSGISPAVAPSFANGTMITNPTTTNQSNSSGTGTSPSSSSSSAAAAPLEMAGLTGIMGLAGLVAAALI